MMTINYKASYFSNSLYHKKNIVTILIISNIQLLQDAEPVHQFVLQTVAQGGSGAAHDSIRARGSGCPQNCTRLRGTRITELRVYIRVKSTYWGFSIKNKYPSTLDFILGRRRLKCLYCVCGGPGRSSDFSLSWQCS